MLPENMLKYHRAYIESPEHAVKYHLTDQHTETYDVQEFMGMIGSVSYNCHLAGLNFVSCMNEIQSRSYKNFDLRSLKRQLLNDAGRSAETFRYREKEIRTYLELSEELPLWNRLLEQIKYSQ